MSQDHKNLVPILRRRGRQGAHHRQTIARE